jgi:hypothetical protein
MLERPAVYTNRLQCEECGRVSREGERGWRAYLTSDEEEPAEVAVYCRAARLPSSAPADERLILTEQRRGGRTSPIDSPSLTDSRSA